MQLKLQSEKILALLLGCAGFFYSLSAQESPIYNFLINLLAGDYFRFKVNSSPLLGRTKFTCYKFKHNNLFNHFQSQCSHYRKIDDSKTLPNCPAIPVTEKKDLVVPEIAIKDGCLVITVTENQSKLWSITLTGGEDLDEVSKDAVFYHYFLTMELNLSIIYLSSNLKMFRG